MRKLVRWILRRPSISGEIDAAIERSFKEENEVLFRALVVVELWEQGRPVAVAMNELKEARDELLRVGKNLKGC